MKFGMLTNPKLEILNEIKSIQSLGFDFVEIGIEGPEGIPEIIFRKKDKILDLLKKNTAPAIGHTFWGVELGSTYEPDRKQWVEECKKYIDVASELKLPAISFHSHSKGMHLAITKERKKILDNIVSSLKELVSYAKIKKIKAMLENSGEIGEVAEFEDFRYIVEKVPDLDVNIDVGHAFLNGGMEHVERFLIGFKGKILHMHMHDNCGGMDEHLPIGEGEIDFETVAKILKKINYNGTVSFEVFASKEAAKKSMIYFKKILEKA